MLVEDEPTAVSEWKTAMRALIEDQFGDLKSTASNMWGAYLVDPRFSDIAFFGVSAEVQNEVWDLIANDHIAFKTSRMRHSSGNESYQLPSG